MMRDHIYNIMRLYAAVQSWHTAILKTHWPRIWNILNLSGF